ncbi:hypothetical protein VTN96DRAFT_7267 [Rasamsonia emersonii]
MAEKFTTLKLDATGDKAGASATTVRPQIGRKRAQQSGDEHALIYKGGTLDRLNARAAASGTEAARYLTPSSSYGLHSHSPGSIAQLPWRRSGRVGRNSVCYATRTAPSPLCRSSTPQE